MYNHNIILKNPSAVGLWARREKGVSLVIIFFVLTIILGIVLSISILLYNETKIIRNIGNSVIAFYAADSGIEKILYYNRRQTLVNGVSGICSICDSDPDNTNLCSNCTPGVDCDESKCATCNMIGSCGFETCSDCTISISSFFDNKSYDIEVTINSSGLPTINIDSRGNYKNVSRQIQLQINDEGGGP